MDPLRDDELGVPADFTLARDPWPLFSAWMTEATAAEPEDANAMALATADADGLPDVRMVLLKGADPRGLVFYTNVESAKGGQLARNPQAAVVLHWKSLRRQIRARGPIAPVTPEEADAYFASRHRDSRIGAIASRQSRPLADRPTLMAEVAALSERYDDGPIPRPENWTGFRIDPVQMEFWQNGDFRLHDRVRFSRDGAGWSRSRLYP
ncbi:MULTISPECIES: pyridoxamine 5'-phosphate oxidase [Methylobacterium]|uniref:Pyridoxine/pyridoxamine 5'-phosphate oxidase n=1 Tax=Methylobacterium thuringiense TaxID=1003091 RepID=A0ABQ4TKA7_9HYPH|nr:MULTISPECIES: pyridoxamine 5'-phosphate oxidase [Methylobacterium]TXN19987.1 pyridoxamine 5'-phosphate oxidase [Methylobacterium sp. WL9]GJE55711.1 Pyridoxine/pyridoxamine 5'-phosphate oxidase [Methylobacterium thuringiense]